MADVTDAAFRFIIVKYSRFGGRNIKYEGKTARRSAKRGGRPAVMFTEFTSADGLCSPAGRKKLLINLKYSEKERPIVAQIFGGRPEKIREAAKLVRKLGFDGLDINMGCPDRKVEKQGGGAALMKNPELAAEILRAAKEGAAPLPVSVKTRLGYGKDELEKWLPVLLAEKPAAITIHARTRKEMSDVPARWERIKKAVEIRNALKSETLIIGNGDVRDLADAKVKAAETGADGIMLGRAVFGNPWLFANPPRAEHGWRIEHPPRPYAKADIPAAKKLAVMVEHAKLFEKLFRRRKNFSVMKKHFKAYVSGFDGAKELRARLMETKNVAEVEEIIRHFLQGRTL